MINDQPVQTPRQALPQMAGGQEVTLNGLSLASTIVYHIETGKPLVCVCADALELTSRNQIVVKAVKQYEADGVTPKWFQPAWTNDPQKCKVKPELIHPFSQRQMQLIKQEHKNRLAGNNQGIDSNDPKINMGNTAQDLTSTNLPNEVAELENEDLRKLCSALEITGYKASSRKKLISMLSDYPDRADLIAEIENISPIEDEEENLKKKT